MCQLLRCKFHHGEMKRLCHTDTALYHTFVRLFNIYAIVIKSGTIGIQNQVS